MLDTVPVVPAPGFGEIDIVGEFFGGLARLARGCVGFGSAKNQSVVFATHFDSTG